MNWGVCRSGASRAGLVAGAQFAKPLNGRLAKAGGLPGNGKFAIPAVLGHTTIERRDQLAQGSGEATSIQRHRDPPLRGGSRRETFHTSPHPSQRQ